MEEKKHVPVMLTECVEGLRIRPDGLYVDATLGGAGHAACVAEKLTTGRLFGIDRDDVALREAGRKLAPFGDTVTFIKSDYRYLASRLRDAGVEAVDGILFDLGVSSFQLDEAQRGFSYMQDAPLDMRMDRSGGRTAAELVNTLSKEELQRILYEYGEERYAPRIAEAIVEKRQKKPIGTTLELADLIRSAMPAAARREQQHPAKRSFQAIRIAVNDELNAIGEALEAAVDILKPDGRILVISFHSLEDRIVKQTFVRLARGCICPSDFPACVCGQKAKLELVSTKPILPGEEEIRENPRARSAKLRIAQKL